MCFPTCDGASRHLTEAIRGLAAGPVAVTLCHNSGPLWSYCVAAHLLRRPFQPCLGQSKSRLSVACSRVLRRGGTVHLAIRVSQSQGPNTFSPLKTGGCVRVDLSLVPVQPATKSVSSFPSSLPPSLYHGSRSACPRVCMIRRRSEGQGSSLTSGARQGSMQDRGRPYSHAPSECRVHLGSFAEPVLFCQVGCPMPAHAETLLRQPWATPTHLPDLAHTAPHLPICAGV